MAKFISAYRALEILSNAVGGWLPMFPLKVSEFSEEEGEALLSGVAMMIKSILDCSTYDVPAWLLMNNGIIGNENDEEFKASADKRFSEFAEFVHKIIAEAKISRGEEKRMSEYIVRETGYPGAIKQEIVGELVRCKDCKWGKEKCGNIECNVDMNVPSEYHGYEWFCPNGERGETDGNHRL